MIKLYFYVLIININEKKLSDAHGKMKSVSVDSVRYDVIHQCSKIGDPKTLEIGVKNKWN